MDEAPLDASANLEEDASEPAEDKKANTAPLKPALLIWFCVALFGIILLRAFVLEVYIVVGDSMEPTLIHDEHLLVNKLIRRFGAIERDDILVFTHPDDPRKHLIKRVIALPGETLSIRAGHVFIGQREIGQDYLDPEQLDPSINTSPYTVPPGYFYVLGDNRRNSRDSRSFGAINRARIIGRTLCILWSDRRGRGL